MVGQFPPTVAGSPVCLGVDERKAFSIRYVLLPRGLTLLLVLVLGIKICLINPNLKITKKNIYKSSYNNAKPTF